MCVCTSDLLCLDDSDVQVGSATIRLNCSRWSIHHLFVLLPSSLLVPASVGPSPSPVPSLKTLRPCSFAWGHVIPHCSQRLSLVRSPPHGAKQKRLCVGASCMSTNPSFHPRCNFDPFLLLSVTSVRIGGGKWEPDAFVDIPSSPEFRLSWLWGSQSYRDGSCADRTSALCLFENRHPACGISYIHMFGVPENHMQTRSNCRFWCLYEILKSCEDKGEPMW